MGLGGGGGAAAINVDEIAELFAFSPPGPVCASVLEASIELAQIALVDFSPRTPIPQQSDLKKAHFDFYDAVVFKISTRMKVCGILWLARVHR